MRDFKPDLKPTSTDDLEEMTGDYETLTRDAVAALRWAEVARNSDDIDWYGESTVGDFDALLAVTQTLQKAGKMLAQSIDNYRTILVHNTRRPREEREGA